MGQGRVFGRVFLLMDSVHGLIVGDGPLAAGVSRSTWGLLPASNYFAAYVEGERSSIQLDVDSNNLQLNIYIYRYLYI